MREESGRLHVKGVTSADRRLAPRRHEDFAAAPLMCASILLPAVLQLCVLQPTSATAHPITSQPHGALQAREMAFHCLGDAAFPLPEGYLKAQERYLLEHGPITAQNFNASHVGRSTLREEGDCPICLEELDPSDTSPTMTGSTNPGDRNVYTLHRCGHKFHRDCLITGTRTDSSCPYCRTPFLPTAEENAIVSGRWRFMLAIFTGYFEYGDDFDIRPIPIAAKELSSIVLCTAYVLSEWGAHREIPTPEEIDEQLVPGFRPAAIGKEACGRQIVEGIIKTIRKLDGKGISITDLIEMLLEEAMHEIKLGVVPLPYAQKKSIMRFGRKVAQLAVHAYAERFNLA